MARTKQTAAAVLRRLLAVPSTVQPIQPQKTRKRRSKPGSKAEREIRKLQNTTDLRLIREILQGFMTDLRIVKDVSEILQEAGEAYIVKIFQDADKIAKNAKRQTVMVEDLLLARDLNQREK